MSKKKKTIIGVVVAVVFIIVAAIATTFIILNKEKTPITTDEFYEVMEDNGYELLDSTDQYDEMFGEDIVDESYIAMADDYQFEFLDMNSVDDAIILFKEQVKIFKDAKGTVSGSTSVSGKNYQKYSLTTDGRFKCISRIDDTAVFVDIDQEYKDEVQEMIDEINY